MWEQGRWNRNCHKKVKTITMLKTQVSSRMMRPHLHLLRACWHFGDLRISMKSTDTGAEQPYHLWSGITKAKFHPHPPLSLFLSLAEEWATLLKVLSSLQGKGPISGTVMFPILQLPGGSRSCFSRICEILESGYFLRFCVID